APSITRGAWSNRYRPPPRTIPVTRSTRLTATGSWSVRGRTVLAELLARAFPVPLEDDPRISSVVLISRPDFSSQYLAERLSSWSISRDAADESPSATHCDANTYGAISVMHGGTRIAASFVSGRLLSRSLGVIWRNHSCPTYVGSQGGPLHSAC